MGGLKEISVHTFGLFQHITRYVERRTGKN